MIGDPLKLKNNFSELILHADLLDTLIREV